MKKVLLLLLVIFCLFAQDTFGQTPQFFNANTSSSNNNWPLNAISQINNRCQWKYGPNVFSSLGGGLGVPAYSGLITDVYFRLGSGANATSIYNINMAIGQDASTTPTFANGTYITGLTPILVNTSYSLTGAVAFNWYRVTLPTPYLYNPATSMYFEIYQAGIGGGNLLSQNNIGGTRIYGGQAATGGVLGSGLVDFGFDLIPNTPCTGQPNAGTTTGPVSPCPGVNATYFLTGATLASGLSYQWLNSTVSCNGPWNIMLNDTNSSMTTQPTVGVTTYYRAVVTCDSLMLSDTSSCLAVTPQSWSPFSPCYCGNSSATSTALEDIGQFNIGTFSNPAVAPTPQAGNPSSVNLYSNFDTLLPVPIFIQGQTYPISALQISTSTALGNSWFKAWIDYDHNTAWDPNPLTEEIFSSASNAGNGFNPTGTFTVPTTALPGLTRLRAVLDRTTNANVVQPCGTYTFGETEDYVVNILAAGPYDPAVTSIQVFPNGGCMDSCENVVVEIRNFGSSILDFSILPLEVNLRVLGPNGLTVYTDTLNSGFLNPFAVNSSFVVFPCVNFYEGGCYLLNTDTLNLLGGTNSNLVNDSLFSAIQVCNTRPNNGGDYNLCLGDTIPSGQGLSIINCPTGLTQDSVIIPFTLSFAGNTIPNPSLCASVGAAQFASATLPALPSGANILSGELGVSNLQLAGLTFTTNPSLTRFSLHQGPVPPPAANVYHNGLQGNTSTANIIPFDYVSAPSAVDLNAMYAGIGAGNTVNMGHWSTNRCTAPNVSVNSNGTTTVYLKIVYEYIPMGISWYEQPSGGVRISDSSILNPLLSPNTIVTNSNTAGTYTFYGACAADTNCRVASNLIIQGVAIDSVSFTNVLCNGDSTGSAYIQGIGGTSGLYYTLNNGSVIDTNTSGSFMNLPVGTYTLNVHDSSSCNGNDTSITITAPPVLTIDSIISTTPTCLPGNDATLTVFAQGGINPLSYSNGGLGQVSNVFTNQGGGNYLVTVTDSNSCIDTSSHLIIAPIPPTWNIVTSDTVNCFGDSSGTITLSTNPGASTIILDSIVAPAAWVQAISSGTVIGLPAGTYTLRATDANNCSIDTTVTIATPSQMIWTSAIADSVDCNGDSTGSIAVVSTGGTGTAHTYSITPVVGSQAPSGNFTNLNAQTYTVTAADDNACTLDTTLTISEPAILTIDTISVTQVACYGDSSGSIVLTSLGGTPSVTYNTPVPGLQVVNGTITNLPAGTYSITGTDLNGCTASTTVTITQPPALAISSVVVDSVACNGDTTGSATIVLTGGTPIYNCTIVPNVGSQQTPGDFTGLPAGTYTINCSDANACTISTMVTILEPTALSYTSVTSTNVSCNGANDGSIIAVGAGGTAPLSYNMTLPPFTISGPGNFTGLNGGVKAVSLIDGNGCSLDSIVNINEPAVLTISPAATVQVNCNGDTTGQILMTSTGGTAPVVYTITPSATQSSPGAFTGLGAGTYYLVGTDSNNCTAFDTVTIIQPTAVTIDSVVSTIPTCVPGGDATMTIYAQGGTAPLFYSNGIIPTPQPSNVFPNQNAGSYNVEVVDAFGCMDTTTHIISTPGAPIWSTITAIPVLCFGDSNGSIAVSTTGGNGMIAYSILPNLGVQTPVGNFVNLPAGNYTLNAVDQNNCSITTSAVVSTPTSLNYASILIDSVDCNGDCDGSISVSSVGGIPPYSYSIISPTVVGPNSTGAFNMLCANTFTVQITDSNNCTNDTILTVAEPAVLALSSSSSTNILCNGDSTGGITLAHTGGTGIPVYTIAPNLGNQTTAGTFTDLPAGIFIITGIDANNCSATVQVTLTEPTPLIIDSIVSTVPSCVPGNDATLTIYASGGVGIINYSNGLIALPGQASNVFLNQGAGTYLVTVTDGNGCRDTMTHIIATPGAPTWNTISATPVLCNGDSNGTIVMSTIGGTGTITFSILPNLGVQTPVGTFSNLPAGNYTLNAVDQNNCSITSAAIITTPVSLSFASILIDSVDCNAACDGSIAVSGAGGILPYSYSIISPTVVGPNTSGIFNMLCTNAYTVRISDSNNCIYDTMLNVSEPAALALSNSSTTNVLCNGDSTGAFLISSTGGTGAIVYSITPNLGLQAPLGSFSNLPVGLYTITGTDGNNCSATIQVTIIEPAPLVIDSIVSSIPSCVPGNDATLTVFASGGNNATYAYYNTIPVLGPGQASNLFSNQGAGSYTITVTDANGCSVQSTHVIATPGAPTWASVSHTDVLCTGDSTGSITALVTPGNDTNITTTIILPIAWNATPIPATNLPANAYTIQAIDGNGCSIVSIVNIIEPPVLTINSAVIDSVACFGDSTGSITITMAGGTPGYNYSISPDPNGVGTINSGVFNGLPQGVYTVNIDDTNSCNTSTVLVVNEPNALSFTSVISTNVSCSGAADGSIIALGTGGAGTLSYSLVPLGTQAPLGTFTGLSGGNHILTLADANACTLDSTINISEPNLFAIDTNSTTPILCFGDSTGQIVMTSSGGTAPVSYAINPVVGTQAGGTFSNLPAGVYIITATDGNACTAIQTYTIMQPPSAVVISNLSGTPASCVPGNDGTITVTANGGVPNLQYATNLSFPIFQTSNSFANLPGGSYTVYVMDANACVLTDTISLLTPGAPVFTSVTNTMPLCNGDSTGSITAVASGVSAITYSLNPLNGGVQVPVGTFSNLPAGNYTITASDVNGCSVNNGVLLTEPNVVMFTNVTTDSVNCNGASDGSITISGNGGTGTLAYTLLPNIMPASNPPAVFTNLLASIFTARITDGNGCIADSLILVSEPAPFIIDTISVSNVLCLGDSSGQIVMTSSGGTGQINYVASPFAGTQVGGNFSNLPAGIYTITATDANNCASTSTYSITEPATSVSISSIISTPPSCNPGNDGTITITANGGTGVLSYLINPGSPVAQMSNTFTGLASNNYLVSAIDQNGCTDTTNYNLSSPLIPAWGPVTSTDALCNGDSSGTISSTVVGGTMPISFSIVSPLSFIQTNATGNFNNLPANTYIIEANDSNNCNISMNVIINEPTALSFASTITDSVDCNGGNDGSIIVLGAGGTGSLTYGINPVAAQAPAGTFTSLSAMNYLITITDSNMCTADTSLTIYEPAILSIDTLNIFDVLCMGDSTAQISVMSTGGTGIVNYTLAPNLGMQMASGTFTNLPAGTYSITATDANNCVATATYVVTEPSTNVLINNVTGTSPSCNPGSDGTITVLATGGTGALSYLLNPGSAMQQTSNLFTGLVSNTYLLSAIDNNGCIDTMSYVLNNAVSPIWNLISSTDALCNGDSTGTISVTTTGGTLPINYSIILPVSFSQTNITGNFMNLPAGTFTVEAVDSNGCSITNAVTIGQPNALSFASIVSDSVSCNGLSDGQLIAAGTGGIAPYTYALNPTAAQLPAGTFNNLAANNYTLSITDSNNCQLSNQVVIYEPLPLTIDTSSSVDVLCNGGNSGSIYVQSSGGTGSIYHVIGSDTIFNNPANFLNYQTGNYSITAIDANGCNVITSVTVNQPTPLMHSVSSTNVLCFGNSTGTITILGSGGVGNYSYGLPNPTNPINTIGIFNGLAAGNYTGVVTDGNGCTDTTAIISITEPTQLVFGTPSVQNIACFGDTTGRIGIAATGGTGPKVITITGANILTMTQPSPANFLNLPAGTYLITATDNNNCTISTTVSLTQNPQIVWTITNTEEICFGDSTAVITFSANGGMAPILYRFDNPLGTFTGQTTYGGLTTGAYLIEAQDVLGCEVDTNHTLLGPDIISFSEFEITPTSCLDTEDGKITVQAIGGRGGRYTYSLEPGFNVNTSGLFRDLAPQTYTLRTSDTAGCFIDTTVDVPLPTNPMLVSVSKEDLGCHGRGNEGRARAIVTGGTIPYTYLWSSTPVQTTARVTGLYKGLHTLDVVDGQGCVERDTFLIEPGPCCQDLFLPTAFSPNGDGRNDEFRILSTADMEIQQFEIRNRWGQKIWESNNFRNSWDGLFGDEPVNVGTYYYILRYKCLTDGQEYSRKGDVIVVR